MNVRMMANYIEVFERGDYRPLYSSFVYDLDPVLAKMLIDNGMADPLEVKVKKTDNKKKEKKNALQPRVRATSKTDKSRSRDSTSKSGGKRSRTKKRAKN